MEEPATCRYVLTFRTPLACEVEDLTETTGRGTNHVLADDVADERRRGATPTTDVPRDADDESIEETTARASRDEL